MHTVLLVFHFCNITATYFQLLRWQHCTVSWDERSPHCPESLHTSTESHVVTCWTRTWSHVLQLVWARSATFCATLDTEPVWSHRSRQQWRVVASEVGWVGEGGLEGGAMRTCKYKSMNTISNKKYSTVQPKVLQPKYRATKCHATESSNQPSATPAPPKYQKCQVMGTWPHPIITVADVKKITTPIAYPAPQHRVMFHHYNPLNLHAFKCLLCIDTIQGCTVNGFMLKSAQVEI